MAIVMSPAVIPDSIVLHWAWLGSRPSRNGCVRFEDWLLYHHAGLAGKRTDVIAPLSVPALTPGA